MGPLRAALRDLLSRVVGTDPAEDAARTDAAAPPPRTGEFFDARTGSPREQAGPGRPGDIAGRDSAAEGRSGRASALPVRMARPMYWAKVTRPEHLGELPAGADVRVLLSDEPGSADLRDRLVAVGAQVRLAPHLVEDEIISATAPGLVLRSRTRACALLDMYSTPLPAVEGPGAEAARDAFDQTWQALDPAPPPSPPPVPAEELLPPEWVPLLPHPTLNPAQAQAAPLLLGTDTHLMVVAPTGAGKTTIGMVAALRTVRERGRKAAWLVPQRSLTDELERELGRWREAGLRVERLSGEYAVDVEKLRDADVWVATTEKFESICRAGALRPALTDVGCLIVDEIHLLGDHDRGPILEALLARVRGEASSVRIVGLSATVANAEQIADWLGAKLVRISWRPSRLLWQLPVITATADPAVANASRARMVAALTRPIVADGGSVLVFCGSRHKVRTTALRLAADRGERIINLDSNNAERVYEVCARAGIGLHYRDWPYKHDAERRFRDREFDVLVATTTVAAGVNLPARAVIVRDTHLGTTIRMSVATIQQMFGRAGRVGAGERAGYAYLICDETERPYWHRQLVGGYTITSGITYQLPDHLLAEAVQGRLATRRQAEVWWAQTLAHHQGNHDLVATADALDFLAAADYVVLGGADDESAEEVADARVDCTELGQLTTRFMVNAETGWLIRSALDRLPVPEDPDTAEDLLLDLLAVAVDELAGAPVTDDVRTALARLMLADGRPDRLAAGEIADQDATGAYPPCQPGDLAKCALKIAAYVPAMLDHPSRKVAGIPMALMYPIWEIAPRYLHWLAGQGHLTTVHPWAAIVAADLGRRIRWRELAPPRGAGRLLWMCEQMATPLHAAEVVPTLYRAAERRRIGSPDWTSRVPPADCRLDHRAYLRLLRDRATGTRVARGAEGVTVYGGAGTVVTGWSGTSRYRSRTESGVARLGPGVADVALFTRRGDYHGTGWLARYHGSGPTLGY